MNDDDPQAPFFTRQPYPVRAQQRPLAWRILRAAAGAIGIALLVLVLIAMIASNWNTKKPAIGEPCGERHHWRWVGPPDPYGDLSCEPDRV